MIDGTYTVSQAAELVGASKNTIRLYSKDFSQFLSAGATPESGQERRFNDEDIKVMVTVKTLRSRKVQSEAVIRALLDGERYEPAEGDEKPTEAPEPEDQEESKELITSELIDVMERFIGRYEARIDSLEGQLEAERVARLDAEVEAARAAGQLEAIYRRHWWQVWRPEGPEEPND